MDIELIIKNYLCFPDDQPVRLRLRDGFTSFVGVNNSGKSSLLKFFFEFRQMFSALASPYGQLFQALVGGLVLNFPPPVLDYEEVFSNTNSRDITIEVKILSEDVQNAAPVVPVVTWLSITVPRSLQSWRVSFEPAIGPVMNNSHHTNGAILHKTGENPLAEFSLVGSACKALADALYIPTFRNAINAGENNNYFDLRVGQAFIKQWQTWQSGRIKKDSEAAYRLVEDFRKLFQFDTLQALPSDDGQTLHLVIDGKSYKLAEVGSGLARFFLVLGNAAIRQPSFILIDEPELSLHPSLQLQFLVQTHATFSEMERCGS